MFKKSADRRKKDEDETNKKATNKYFFDQGSILETDEESYDSMLYDEDNINHL